jgi:hypothetical protein
MPKYPSQGTSMQKLLTTRTELLTNINSGNNIYYHKVEFQKKEVTKVFRKICCLSLYSPEKIKQKQEGMLLVPLWISVQDAL